MIKNVAGQIIGAQLISAVDGSAFIGAVTVYVTGDGGSQAIGSVGSGACVHEGNGFHSYAPAQAETNYDHIAFTFTGSGAIPTTVQLYTADQLLDIPDSVEAGLTVRQALRLLLAVTGGKLSGGNTVTNTFRNAVADSKDRVIATVDAAGNRTAITTDLD